MDTYENNKLESEQIEQNTPPEEPAVSQQTEQESQPEPQPEIYREAEPQRKASPFANSPYVTATPGWQPQPTSGYQQNYGYQPPQTYQQPQAYQQSQAYQQPSSAEPVQPASKKTTKSGGKAWKIVTAAVVAVALVAGSCGITAACVKNYWQEQNQQLTQSFDEKLNVLREQIEANSNAGSGQSVSGSPTASVEGGMTPAQVYALNVNGVVAINCSTVAYNFGQAMESTSSGSGFVLTEDGYIVSNYHVVEGASKITVLTSDGTEYEAEYIGGEESNDIALLKVSADDLQTVTIGSSDALIVGDQVAAIGNPLGELASTLTVGYVSAKDRIVTTDGTQINMLQTDAAINPGNSGGPLFNMKGEVVGITSAKYSGTTTSGATIEGIGFAIPIDDVIGMLEDLKEYGYVTGAYMGVTVSNMDEEDAALYGLPMGVLVRDVTAGSCAQAAGIRVQDIIVNLGGYEIENMNDLTRALRKFNAGDTVTVTVYRFSSGGETQLSITLDEKPQASQQETESTADSSGNSQLPSNGNVQDWFDYYFGN